MLKRLFTPIALSGALIATLTVASPASAAGVNGNPWGYNFVPGKLIYTPNPAFCNGRYFHCIPNFPRGKGYVIECRDGLYSKSGGHSGSCSFHHGNWRILYSH
jgi:hypothetical protein